MAKAKAKAPAARVSRAARAEFDALRAQIDRERTAETKRWDVLWELVARATEGSPALYRARYESFKDFVAAECPGESVRSASRNILVARSFTAADVDRHGVAWLEDAALYAQELAGASDPPRAIDLDRLRVTLPGKGQETVRKTARACTRAELQRARRKAGGATRSTASPREKAVRTALKKVRSLAGVSVRATETTLSLGGVSWGALAALGKALSSLKLPREAR